jgi:hypothetical protein
MANALSGEKQVAVISALAAASGIRLVERMRLTIRYTPRDK